MTTQKGSATVILLVVLVIVLAGVLVYFAFLKKPGEVAVSLTPTPTPTKTATPTPDETANWKTYTNTRYGFEVKYPSDWEQITPNITGQASLTVGFKPKNLSGETLANVFVSNNNLDFLAQHSIYKKETKGGYIFTLQNSGGSDYLAKENQILSTFKFIK